MENPPNQTSETLFSFDPRQYSELRTMERANQPNDLRQARALEHIADDLSVIRCLLQRISQHMPK